MAFFFSGFKTNSRSIVEIDKSFKKIVPKEIIHDRFTIEENSSFLINYGSNKAIKDLIIRDDLTGSWLAIIGTPLFSSLITDEKDLLLGRFFSDPNRFILNEVDGCFALIAHNSSSDTYYLGTDYINSTPIFYSVSTNGLYISSHELPLARFLGSEIYPLGLSLTIHLGNTWGINTRFKNIHRLLPSQIMKFQGVRRISNNRYWRPCEEQQWPNCFEEVLEKWLFRLKKSVRAYYECSVNKSIICDFTAGEDARLILSQCHDLKLPFFAMVDGDACDTDVLVAKKAAQKAGFELVVRPRVSITEDQLIQNAIHISIVNDGYAEYFGACTAFATNSVNPLKNWEYVKLAGFPGGEVFRGSYYWRGKAFFPSRKDELDYLFFTRMKWMLDFHPELMNFSPEECERQILFLVKEALNDVDEFPVGIKIDHLLHVFQSCNSGLVFKNPRYLPLATKDMTRSIYSIPPNYKRGGKLTKACTEVLYPEVAFVKTQKGVPTIRKTWLRAAIFLPEYLTDVKNIVNGAASRLYNLERKARLQSLASIIPSPIVGQVYLTRQDVSGSGYGSECVGKFFAATCKGEIDLWRQVYLFRQF